MFGQGVIPNDWEGEYCCYSVEWPNSPQWLAVLRGVLTMPAQGRFWDANTGTITVAQAVIRETFNNNLHLEEVLMSCNANQVLAIAQALEKIAQAMAGNNAKGCCDQQGTGGGGQYPAPGNTTPQGDPETDPPPDGYDSWDDFFADKCAKATWIVQQLEVDLGNMALIRFTEIGIAEVIAALAAVILLPISGAVIITLAGFLLTAGAIIIITTALSIVNDNEADLICQLYEGSNSVDSRNNFLDRFNNLVDSGVGDPVEGYAVKALMAYMIQPDATNKLYELDQTRTYEAGDCSGCFPEETLQVYDSEGNWIDAPFTWDEETTYTPVVQGNGFYYLQVRIAFAGSITLSNYNFHVTAITNADDGSCGNQGSTPGDYEPISFGGPDAGWLFGCTNDFVPSVTGTFTKLT